MTRGRPARALAAAAVGAFVVAGFAGLLVLPLAAFPRDAVPAEAA